MLLQIAIFCSFSWLSNIPLSLSLSLSVYLYISHIIFIHSSVDRHLGCFHVLAIINSAAVSIGVHVSFQIRVFFFSGYMPRSLIAGSYGNCIFYFKELYTIFHSGCTNLHSHRQCGRVHFLHTPSRSYYL